MSTVDFPLARRGERDLYRKAAAGLLPAEALPTHLRWRLVADLHRAGLTDVEIADYTAMSTYTTCRIRESMGLSHIRPRTEEQIA